MPLSRYQIRNEYSLADPELYRAADKDDPEALLEGVAMAGLVGVLRQLGDLAEFAAEIFRDLHEDVMVTAARGHNLMVRVQQLEAEAPTIEKAFLSQTNHSAFFYNPGLDWHPNMRMDQNLITRGDLPRFVMDSYEECRGPPRLFLLDKFDVAGAGACLKRYSDPSFFKVETSSFGIIGTDVQREKKARKAKKKGSRWRNGETPEALPMSHAKLHQLFLEERIQNGISDPARRVKLKRRLNGFPFASKSGESYMEKFLRSPSPDHKEIHEIPVDSSTYESAYETAKINTLSPQDNLDPRSMSLSSSPAKEEIIPELFVHKLNEVPSCTRDSVVLQSKPDLEEYNVSDSGVEAYNNPSTLQMEDSEKEIAVDGGNKTDDSIDDYQSDDVVSEVDNYLDALTTMESEMDTDSEFKTKNKLHYLNSRRAASDLDANEQLKAHSSDSQSMGNSTLSDDGNSSYKKETSSFSYSDTHSTAAENTPSDGDVSCNVFESTEIHETEIIDSSLDSQPINEEHPQSHPPGTAVLDDLSTEAAKIPSHSSELGDRTASLSPSDSEPSYRSRGTFTKESALMATETDKIVTNPRLNTPHIPSVYEATEQKYYSEQRLSGGNQLMNESEGWDKDASEIVPDTSYLSVSSHSKDDFQLHVLAENQLVHGLNDDGVNADENITSVTNQYLNDDGPQINYENPSLLSTDAQPLDELHGEDEYFSEDAPLASNLSDSSSQLRDGLPVSVSPESLPVKEMDDEYPNSIEDGLSNMAADKKSDESSEDIVPESGTDKNLHIPNSDDNQIDEQNPVIPLIREEPLGQTHYLDAEPGDTVSSLDEVSQSAGEIVDDVAEEEGIPSELPEPLVSETNAEVLSIRSSSEQTSCSKEVYLSEPLDRVDGAEMSEAACHSTLSERDSTFEAEPLLLAGDHVDLDEIDTDYVNASTSFAGHGSNAIDDSDGSSGDLKTLSGSQGEIKALIPEEACLSGRPGEESGATEGLSQEQISLQGCNSGFGQVVENDQSDSESQVLNDVSSTYPLLEAKENVDAPSATTIQSSFQHELESSHTEDMVESLTNQLDQLNVLGANSEVLTDLDETQYEKHIDHVGPFAASSNSIPVNLPSKPSETEFLLQGGNKIDISEPPGYPSSSILPSFPPFPDASQIYVDEMPPMPPLPPVQWRMTKFQHASHGQERVFVQNSTSAFPPLFPSKANQDTETVNQQLPQSALGDENSNPVCEEPMGKAVQLSSLISQVPSVVHHRDSKDNDLPPEGMQYTGSLQLSRSNGEIQHNTFHDERENEKYRLSSSSYLSPGDTASAYALGLSHEEFMEPLNQGAPETSLNEKELVQRSTISEENAVTSDTAILPSKTEYEQPEQAMPSSAHAFGFSNEKLIRPLNEVAAESIAKEKELGSSFGPVEENLGSSDNNPVSTKTEDGQPQRAMSTSDTTLAWPVGEEDKPNGLRPMKLPRPRSPLIDAVAAHDKSKLRKATERVRPQIQEEDERDSLLEQIRSKSFNLKPAVVTRPSIPGPTTNLKVAAILEKAKTIRQAFAGSDEDDDDDSWSDS